MRKKPSLPLAKASGNLYGSASPAEGCDTARRAPHAARPARREVPGAARGLLASMAKAFDKTCDGHTRDDSLRRDRRALRLLLSRLLAAHRPPAARRGLHAKRGTLRSAQ